MLVLLSRIILTTLATIVFTLFLWYSRDWMQQDSIWYVVTINFAIMGLIWFVYDLFKPALNSRWFNSVSFEQGGRLYAAAGISFFREVLRKIGWNRLLSIPGLRRDVESLKKREWGTRFGEATHLACLALLLPIACWSMYSSEGRGLIFWLVSAIVFHAYPIMLQRYLRPRFRRLLEKTNQ